MRSQERKYSITQITQALVQATRELTPTRFNDPSKIMPSYILEHLRYRVIRAAQKAKEDSGPYWRRDRKGRGPSYDGDHVVGILDALGELSENNGTIGKNLRFGGINPQSVRRTEEIIFSEPH